MERVNAKPDAGQLFGVTILTVLVSIPIMSSMLFLTALIVSPHDSPSFFFFLIFGLMAIAAWPISLLLAALLFVSGGSMLLKREVRLNRFHLVEWLIGGAAIGATVAVAMLTEMEYRNDFGLPHFDWTALWLTAPGAGTGLICALFWRWLIARFFTQAVDCGKEG